MQIAIEDAAFRDVFQLHRRAFPGVVTAPGASLTSPAADAPEPGRAP